MKERWRTYRRPPGLVIVTPVGEQAGTWLSQATALGLGAGEGGRIDLVELNLP